MPRRVDLHAPAPSKAAARKRAQRNIKAERCDRCGKTEGTMHRHHPDIDNQPLLVEVVCPKCHAAIDMRSVPFVAVATCEICNEQFQPNRNTHARICKKPECRAEFGRRSARKRWG
jgi:hypothetical protein